ncbi:copper homeostasis protein CutC [Vibrio sp. JPW-9-11-11]|uniref:copper homeostasis protein CutC n=1 Tax=Vibrio sp. JPW-9-11-11 TaxID=1416532 RepID=UPI001593B2F6|nr:copper homeostasis protein CutC [Vibrio sp. JPW-9-11-11]NVD05973.1 copper homeostasis protein CutC [Vibrio sp. JPW-9-11-11]
MKYHIEVCVDNLESLHLAIQGGASRIELCSSLALGGLTPSFGLMKKAGQISPLPVYAMIRPRQGDFVYDQGDIDAMLLDIEAAAEAGLQGVVFGVLTEQGHIDMSLAQQLADKAQLYDLGITFHRAIDQCVDWSEAIEHVISLGCERVLTSGLAASAEQGAEVLKQMVDLADGRVSIMAGAGLTADNVQSIVTQTHVREVHLSGKSTRPSKMKTLNNQAKMGNQNIDDYLIPVTSSQAIEKVVKALSS